MVRDGKITEATSANVFIVQNDKLLTPPTGELLLAGITRQVILEIAHTKNVPVSEQWFTPQQLYDADEVWFSSSTKEICAVINVDGHTIGQGKPGKWCSQFNQWLIESNTKPV